MQFAVTFLAGAIQVWFLWSIAVSFVAPRHTSKKTQIAGAVLTALVMACINQFRIPQLNLISFVIIHTIFTWVLCRIKWYYALLLSAITIGIGGFAETIFALALVRIQKKPMSAEYLQTDTSMIIVQSFTSLVFIAIYLFVKMMMQRKKSAHKLPQNLAVILFPVIGVATLFYVTAVIMDLFSQSQTVSMGLLLGVFAVGGNAASLIGNENVRKRYILQNEIDAMQHQEELTVGLLRQQEEHMKEMKALAHDFKNHLSCLRTLVGEKGPSQASSLQYIDDLLAKVEDNRLYAEIRNEPLRALLLSTDATCEANGIVFRRRIEYSDFAFMSFPDLCILFSNAFDNAIQACLACGKGGKPYIDLKILRKDEMLFVQILNAKRNPIEYRADEIISTKLQPENHGIGLKNMKRVVQKYGGDITVDHDAAEFRLYISMPLDDSAAS
jgi:hypothetical protein